MAYNRDTVEDRVKRRDFAANELKIVKLTKEMDFSNLPTKEVRDCYGSHVYMDISNFNTAISNCGDDLQEQKKIVQALSVLHKSQAAIMKDQSLEPMQIQSARTHAINYKPYDNNKQLAINSIVSAISHITFVYEVFNPIFKNIDNLRCAIGIATGQFLVTNLGIGGRRDNVSLGIAANEGAKIINGHGNISTDKETYDLLSDDLKGIFQKDKIRGKMIYKASSVRWSKYPDLKNKYADDFNNDELEKMTRDYKSSLSLNEIEVSGTTNKLDFTRLSETNNKRFNGLVLFVDLDGFSKRIFDAYKDDKLKETVRVLHGFIAEFQDAVQDFDGVPVQVRGDCLIAVVNLPCEKNAKSKRVTKAIQAATALQSSVEVLNEHFSNYSDLKVAVGVEIGKVLATRLGKYPEKVLIGLPAYESESIQQHFCAGNETAITKSVYDKLKDDTLKKHFKKCDNGHYSAKGLTFDKLDEDLKKSSKKENRTAALGAGTASVGIGTSSNPPQSYVNQSRHCWEDGDGLP